MILKFFAAPNLILVTRCSQLISALTYFFLLNTSGRAGRALVTFLRRNGDDSVTG